MPYDPTDPHSDRRRNEMAALAQEVHELALRVHNPPQKPFWQRYGGIMSFAVTLLVLAGTGYGGYTVLSNTVAQHERLLSQMDADKVDQADLRLELKLRDADIANVRQSQRDSIDRLNEQYKSINQKLDKLIERELNGK